MAATLVEVVVVEATGKDALERDEAHAAFLHAMVSFGRWYEDHFALLDADEEWLDQLDARAAMADGLLRSRRVVEAGRREIPRS